VPSRIFRFFKGASGQPGQIPFRDSLLDSAEVLVKARSVCADTKCPSETKNNLTEGDSCSAKVCDRSEYGQWLRKG